MTDLSLSTERLGAIALCQHNWHLAAVLGSVFRFLQCTLFVRGAPPNNSLQTAIQELDLGSTFDSQEALTAWYFMSDVCVCSCPDPLVDPVTACPLSCRRQSGPLPFLILHWVAPNAGILLPVLFSPWATFRRHG